MGLRTGDEYLAGLKDDREIWYDGKKVENVTTEPGLRNTALTVAQYYDMQNLPHLRDLMTYETPDGDRAHLSFIEPHTVEDLRRRSTGARTTRHWAVTPRTPTCTAAATTCA